MVISGTSPDGRLVEAVEIPDQRFFAAVQYHPEFKSRPNNAHPPISGIHQSQLAEIITAN